MLLLKSKEAFFNLYLDIDNAEKLSEMIRNKKITDEVYGNINEIHVYNVSLSSIYNEYQMLRNKEPKIKALHNSLTKHIE